MKKLLLTTFIFIVFSLPSSFAKELIDMKNWEEIRYLSGSNKGDWKLIENITQKDIPLTVANNIKMELLSKDAHDQWIAIGEIDFIVDKLYWREGYEKRLITEKGYDKERLIGLKELADNLLESPDFSGKNYLKVS